MWRVELNLPVGRESYKWKWKKKYEKSISGESEKLSKPNYIAGKHLGCPPCKVLGTILEVDEGRTSTNGP